MPKRYTLNAIRYTSIYAVILVGGKGKRLKPLSTAARPKAFLSITRDRKTMFRRTLDRIGSLVKPENIIVVANRAHAKLVKKDFPDIGKENLLLEPAARNTAPAIALAASVIEKRDKDACIVVFPTDQYITEEENFLEPVRRGINFLNRDPSAIIILGVKPRYPSTHFGYIKTGGGPIAKVERFVEKPDRATAEKYLQSGNYLWNMGAFILKAETASKLMRKFAPKIYNTIFRAPNIKEAYKKVPNISIDYAVIEKYRNIYCVKADYEWHDLGGFESLIKILTREKREFELKGGKVVSIK